MGNIKNMKPIAFTESEVESAALTWLESLGCQVQHGPEIAPGELFAERVDYGELVLKQRLRNPLLPKLISEEIRVKGA